MLRLRLDLLGQRIKPGLELTNGRVVVAMAVTLALQFGLHLRPLRLQRLDGRVLQHFGQAHHRGVLCLLPALLRQDAIRLGGGERAVECDQVRCGQCRAAAAALARAVIEVGDAGSPRIIDQLPLARFQPGTSLLQLLLKELARIGGHVEAPLKRAGDEFLGETVGDPPGHARIGAFKADADEARARGGRDRQIVLEVCDDRSLPCRRSRFAFGRRDFHRIEERRVLIEVHRAGDPVGQRPALDDLDLRGEIGFRVRAGAGGPLRLGAQHLGTLLVDLQGRGGLIDRGRQQREQQSDDDAERRDPADHPAVAIDRRPDFSQIQLALPQRGQPLVPGYVHVVIREIAVARAAGGAMAVERRLAVHARVPSRINCTAAGRRRRSARPGGCRARSPWPPTGRRRRHRCPGCADPPSRRCGWHSRRNARPCAARRWCGR